MMQPIVTNAPVAMPHSSAPSIVAMAMSRGVRNWPSVCTTMRLRRSLSHEHLVRLGQPKFPRGASVLDRTFAGSRPCRHRDR